MRKPSSKIPKGKVIRFEDLRQIISRKHQAYVTCPPTAGIFLNVASKAPGGVEAHHLHLEAEGVKVVTKPRGKKLIVADIDKYAVPVSTLL